MFKCFKKFLEESVYKKNFKSENDFVSFCKELSKKLKVTYEDYEYYGSDECEFYFSYKGKHYCFLFSPKVALFSMKNDESHYMGIPNNALSSYSDFDKLLKDIR